MPRRKPLPPDVDAITTAIARFINSRDDSGRIVGNAKYGVYAFYDYDGEPIYVGQTSERLRVRIRRHLTNQRTDAVAMNVLDPFEVAEIEMWPLYPESGQDIQALLNAAEYTVYELVIQRSTLKAILNEKDIPSVPTIELPPSYRTRIVPDDVYDRLQHPDIRIARRATTIANLARVISERTPSKGLRRTLLTQARRLEKLARERLDEFTEPYPVTEPDDE